MKILVTGASGLVGSSLVPFLTSGGHSVSRLVRKLSGKDGEVLWRPDRGEIDESRLEGFDAVVHLAGESIAAGRWSPARKKAIRDSRVNSTALLCSALARLKNPPKALVCASATGAYGNRGDEVLTEDSSLGEDFLAQTCRAWEAAALPAIQRGIRTVHLRFGVILSPRGGALQKVLLPFKLGLGGRLGLFGGKQYMPWVSIDDAVGIVHFALTNPQSSGVYNAVGPEAVTNNAYTKALGRALMRPTLFPVPYLALWLLFGEMADALLFSSQRVLPKRLLEQGYKFRHETVEAALRHVLGRKGEIALSSEPPAQEPVLAPAG
jgi:hypothetical protein